MLIDKALEQLYLLVVEDFGAFCTELTEPRPPCITAFLLRSCSSIARTFILSYWIVFFSQFRAPSQSSSSGLHTPPHLGSASSSSGMAERDAISVSRCSPRMIISLATNSVVNCFFPSASSQRLVCSLPSTYTRFPLCRYWLQISAKLPQATTLNHSVSS